MYSTHQAAKYLKIARVTLVYHIKVGNINPKKIGTTWVFTKEQLDHFKQTKRPQGRPRKV